MYFLCSNEQSASVCLNPHISESDKAKLKWPTKTQLYDDAKIKSDLNLVKDEDYLLNFTLVEAKEQLKRWDKAQQNAKRSRRNNGLEYYLNNGRWSSNDNDRSTRTMDPVDFDRVAQGQSISLGETVKKNLFCNENYQLFADHCYMVVREPLAYEQAADSCAQSGGELLSIENGNELKHALRLSNEVNREIWLLKMRDYLKAAVDVVASGQAENIDIDRFVFSICRLKRYFLNCADSNSVVARFIS